MKIIAIIPARMASTRFPGKPLAPILGLPMIEHVRRRTAMCEDIDAVYVATPDQEVHEAVKRYGGTVIMTSDSHSRPSERVAEAASALALSRGHAPDVVVMVQGDEPMVTPEMISASVQPFISVPRYQRPQAWPLCANLMARIQTEEEWRDPNTIKVVTDKDNNALYFSRQPIPTPKSQDVERLGVEDKLAPRMKQVCIIPFTYQGLKTYVSLEPSSLEYSESIDMMRFLENGYGVRMVETTVETHAVDTEADRVMVENLMCHDPLVLRYWDKATI